MSDDRGSGDLARPFRGSVARRSGDLTRGRLRNTTRHVRLAADTYVAAHVPVDVRVRVAAQLVRAGPTAVATGWSAVAVRGLDVAPGEMPVELACPDRRLRGGGVTVRRQYLAADEVEEHDGLRCTSPLRTAFDLATRCDLADAVVAADALARLDRFTGADLLGFARRHPGARGVRRVARVAALVEPRSESPPETRVRLHLVLAGLPAPIVQCQVFDGELWVARVDLGWPRFRVALEYDGRDHTKIDRRGRDLDRIDDLERAGWIVLVVTARQLRDPARLVRRVARALGSRGMAAVAHR